MCRTALWDTSKGNMPMQQWTNDELHRIGSTEELRVAALQADGTLRKPVIIWVVRLGDELYVRSVNGRTSAWFGGIEVQHAGRIWAGGMEKDVSFVEDSDLEVNKKIDEAYAAKYRRYPASVEHINSPTARSATIKLVPRQADA
jgi:hypothetical protein